MKRLPRLCLWLLALAAGQAHAFTVEKLDVPSEAMKRSIPVVAVIPDSNKSEFPVIYLLHGFGGNGSSWLAGTEVGELADQHGVIIVCPNGENSWYFDSPEQSALKFETFISDELVSFIDKRYRAISAARGRALAGFSMGGHGALYLAIRHPDVFGAAASMAGGVDIRPFPKNWDLPKILGPIESHRDRWTEYSVVTQARTLKDGTLALSLDCGEQDFFLEVNRSLHRQLEKQNVAHRYRERSGGHDGIYLRAAMPDQIAFLADFFAKTRPRPSDSRSARE